MTALLIEMLKSINLAKRIDSGTLERGLELFQSGGVINMFFVKENQVDFLVRGQKDLHEVSIRLLEKQRQISFNCDCPNNWGSWGCKHTVAAYYYLIDHFSQSNIEGKPNEPHRTADWEFPLSLALSQNQIKPRQQNYSNRYAVALYLQILDQFYGENFMFNFVKVKTSELPSLDKGSTAEEVNTYLKHDISWLNDSNYCGE